MFARDLFPGEFNAVLSGLLRKLVGYAALDEKAFRLLTGVAPKQAEDIATRYPDVDLADYETRSFVWGVLGALAAFYPTRVDTQIEGNALAGVQDQFRAGLARLDPAWAKDGGL
ncbi:hypothetical protein [Maricaulis maris]|jgi:hypothetical protein|uniref:hypothetical protein n=1 Tax=Maricaulis maris TaxID=74318 RepID=UPI00291D17B2|nr:hypothetical protein MACH15_13790 [Maricaulis maris]